MTRVVRARVVPARAASGAEAVALPDAVTIPLPGPAASRRSLTQLPREFRQGLAAPSSTDAA